MEVEAVRRPKRLIPPPSRSDRPPAGHAVRSAYATTFFSRQTYNDSSLLRDIEDRIARLTMIRQPPPFPPLPSRPAPSPRRPRP